MTTTRRPAPRHRAVSRHATETPDVPDAGWPFDEPATPDPVTDAHPNTTAILDLDELAARPVRPRGDFPPPPPWPSPVDARPGDAPQEPPADACRADHVGDVFVPALYAENRQRRAQGL